MIKVIAFDFGNVLGPDADAFSTSYKNLIKATGLPAEELQKIFNKHWPDLKVGKKKTSIFWLDIANNSKYPIKPKKLEEIYFEAIKIYPQVFSIAKNLYEKKVTLVILSNDAREWMDFKVNNFKEFRIFKKIYCSAYLMTGKPDKKIFKIVLKDLGLKPNELLFIDNQENNIKVASALGINSILFTNARNLKSKLNNFIH